MAVIRLSNPLLLLAAFVVLPWAVVCALTLRVPYEGLGPEGIADERAFYVTEVAGQAHPIEVKDYQLFSWARDGLDVRDMAAEDPRLLILVDGDRIDLAPGVAASVVAQSDNIGIFGYAAGTDVHVVDSRGLGDPIGGRLQLGERGRPGHEKSLGGNWILARFGDPAAALQPGRADVVAVARKALDCDGPRRLVEAVAQPLTLERFMRNLVDSFRLHRLRIPPGPVQAANELC